MASTIVLSSRWVFFRWSNTGSSEELLSTSLDEMARFSGLVSRVTYKMQQILPRFAVPSVFVPVQRSSICYIRQDRPEDPPIGCFQVLSKATLDILQRFIHRRREGYRAHNRYGTELQLAILWAEVSGLQSANDIKRGDDFLSLGGESLLAIKLVSAARSSGLDLSVETVMKNRVLSDMALHVNYLSPNLSSYQYGQRWQRSLSFRASPG